MLLISEFETRVILAQMQVWWMEVWFLPRSLIRLEGIDSLHVMKTKKGFARFGTKPLSFLHKQLLINSFECNDRFNLQVNKREKEYKIYDSEFINYSSFYESEMKKEKTKNKKSNTWTDKWIWSRRIFISVDIFFKVFICF